jgi:hypothetical protein
MPLHWPHSQPTLPDPCPSQPTDRQPTRPQHNSSHSARTNTAQTQTLVQCYQSLLAHFGAQHCSISACCCTWALSITTHHPCCRNCVYTAHPASCPSTSRPHTSTSTQSVMQTFHSSHSSKRQCSRSIQCTTDHTEQLVPWIASCTAASCTAALPVQHPTTRPCQFTPSIRQSTAQQKMTMWVKHSHHPDPPTLFKFDTYSTTDDAESRYSTPRT